MHHFSSFLVILSSNWDVRFKYPLKQYSYFPLEELLQKIKQF